MNKLCLMVLVSGLFGGSAFAFAADQIVTFKCNDGSKAPNERGITFQMDPSKVAKPDPTDPPGMSMPADEAISNVSVLVNKYEKRVALPPDALYKVFATRDLAEVSFKSLWEVEFGGERRNQIVNFGNNSKNVTLDSRGNKVSGDYFFQVVHQARLKNGKTIARMFDGSRAMGQLFCEISAN